MKLKSNTILWKKIKRKIILQQKNAHEQKTLNETVSK